MRLSGTRKLLTYSIAKEGQMFDLELIFDEKLKERIETICGNQSNSSNWIVEKRGKSWFALRDIRPEAKQENLDNETRDFLSRLRPFFDLLKEEDCKLRIGCFFEIENHALYSLEISRDLMKTLNTTGFAIQFEVYPTV